MSSSNGSSPRSSKTASKPGEGVRLNRWLAECGICSRREADELIRAGEVSVNDEVCSDLGRRIDPASDRVFHQGRELRRVTEKVYLMLNKPRGYVVTHSDELQRQTIYGLLPDSAANLRYAGRLDKNSEGLLLLTNDGELINALTHPKRRVEKVYRVEINRHLSRKELEDLRRGVQIEGGITQPAGVFVKNDSGQGMTLKMVITEGRKRQIRQMVEAVGAKVLHLRRLQFGTLLLKDLPLGRWRYLSGGEIRSLKGLTENPKK
ncbi:MAG: rRNA pseudouridine synthase [Candidatus Cloacimonetes bacterium]|nr:rRNA pseudouridine synthase [Candidatus Cloacimonadota bacterium]